MILNILQRILNKIAFFAPGGFTLRPWLHKIRGVKIGNNVWISQYVYIDEVQPEAIIIQENCSIGLRTSIFSHFYWGNRRSRTNQGGVVIEKDVYIGPHCVILPNVHIGEGSVIKAGTVVARNVPPHTFFGTPSPESLGIVSVPLTPNHTYEEFRAGLKPFRKKDKTGN
jgi:acetyltransferase-like isoleucine patch superfamily enzyme